MSKLDTDAPTIYSLHVRLRPSEIARLVGVSTDVVAAAVMGVVTADAAAPDDLTDAELDQWDADCAIVGTAGMVIPRLIREVRRRRAAQTERKAVAS